MIKISKLEKKLSSGFTLKIDDLVINDGEKVALIGSNGSGKSTLLKLLAGIIKADNGSVVIDGKIGYEPQNPYCFSATVRNNISISSDNKDVAEIIKLMKLEGYENRKATKLSGGEKQRMYLGRMLSGDYDCLLLDEPLSAVDIDVSQYLENVIRDYCNKNSKTLLMATHLPSQALNIASKVLIMNGGEIAEYSDIEALKDPKSDFGKKFTELWRIS